MLDDKVSSSSSGGSISRGSSSSSSDDEEEAALCAAKQQRQSLSSVLSRKDRSLPGVQDSIKSIVIDSKVIPFVSTVPRLLPPALGRVRVRDFRDKPQQQCPRRGLRVVSWNVERGYRLASVLSSLKNEMADVIMLSEVDCGCARSQMIDVGAEIASALKMCMVFATEKIRVNDEFYGADSPSSVSDADAFDGVEGIAILSFFDVLDHEPLFLPDASKKNDPRKQRLALRATIRAGDRHVDVVALHLDAYAGRSSRVEQFRPVLDRLEQRKQEYSENNNGENDRAVVVGGDLNTHNHGLVALIPGMTGDDYWLRRLWRGESSQNNAQDSSSSSHQLQQHWNQTEAEWWQANVFDSTTLVDPFDKSHNGHHNTNVHVGGLKLWGGKLDWLLFDRDYLRCTGKFVSRGNEASDHPYLRLDLDFLPSS